MTQIAKGNNYGYSEKVIDLIKRHNQILGESYDKLWQVIEKNDPDRRVVFLTPSVDSMRISPIDNDSAKITEAFWAARNYSRQLFKR